jgi:hypothetical protein
MHSGVVLNDTDAPGGSDWEYVVGNWGQDDGIGDMTAVAGETDKWEISLNIEDYYGLPEGTNVNFLSFVFRSADGSAVGKGAGASDIFVKVPVEAPIAPTNLAATDTGFFSVSLAWDDNASNELGYIVERALDGEDFYQTVSLGSDVVSVTDAVLDGTSYIYRVAATNAYGPNSAYSNEVTVTTPLAVPSGLIATPYDLNSIALSWNDNSLSEDAYVIERAIKLYHIMEPYEEIATVSSDETTFLDEDAPYGFKVFYRVKAVSGLESSDYSNEAEARISIDPFRVIISPSIISDGTLNIEIIDNEAQGYDISVYNRSGVEILSAYEEEPGEFTYNVSDWNSGVYHVQVRTNFFRISRVIFIR